MQNNENLQLFEDQPIRTAWNEDEEEWYFSIVYVIGVLTESPNPHTYCRVMKKRLKDEGMKPLQIVTLWNWKLLTANAVLLM